MAAKKLKRRHHTVPRFHLRRFADDREQVTQVELPGSKRIPVSIGDATVTKDFYLAPAVEGGHTDAVEDALGELESAAATTVHALLDEGVWPITSDMRERLAAWIAIQYLRTPGIRDRIQAVDNLVVQATRHDGAPQHTVAEHDGQHPYRTVHLETMFAGFLPATRALYAQGWTLIHFTRKALITSDGPVSLLPLPDADERTPLGLNSNGGVLVPLDRRVALLTTDHPVDVNVQGTTARANALNQYVASTARRWVFHHPADDPLRNLELPAPQEPDIRAERWDQRSG